MNLIYQRKAETTLQKLPANILLIVFENKTG